MIIISACLVGLPTRYDLEVVSHPHLVELVKKGLAIPLCPEQLGGLSTPRSPSTIEYGDGEDVVNARARIISSEGVDVTENFLRGAYAVLDTARLVSAEEAVLKEGSPSCGINYTNRGFERIKGMGVLSYLLHLNGINLRAVE
ncbi:hypothetical protein CH333_06645 [candidate division WOR-3 bacterium JGI_Cruoil_03_44_89]|uniref:Uncharacterized protein n=1 Tax=candidate division WOR-3 bacterium JGI_Cruoil_03_44_89 TaxID=1973748 RepID=A0A235BRV4_UNCW3|nr:MAG: hypothetical protein CH333_06645 [candidate division WOR-3 bacterium JGI_Cruoil_03_44_89]